MGKDISRRQFLLGLGAGVVSLVLTSCGIKSTKPSASAAASATKPTPTPKKTESPTNTPIKAAPSPTPIGSGLVVAEGTNPDSLMQRGLSGIGGIGQFVKPGNTVVIKPNFSVLRTPDKAATTDPRLVAALVKQCLNAGAKEVKVLDFPFMGPACLSDSGIKDAVEAAGGKAFIIDKKQFYREVDTGGKTLKKILYSTDVLEADVFINFPKLKHHSTTKMTMSLKNLMGIVYDRQYFHSTDLNRTIAELTAFQKADLIIMDATRGITTKGPRGPGKIKEWNQVVFGVDPVAVDAYGANLFGMDPLKLKHLKIAADLGVGEMDLTKINVTKV
jgi:uncharacterized protein (DUF362 family)